MSNAPQCSLTLDATAKDTLPVGICVYRRLITEMTHRHGKADMTADVPLTRSSSLASLSPSVSSSLSVPSSSATQQSSPHFEKDIVLDIDQSDIVSAAPVDAQSPAIAIGACTTASVDATLVAVAPSSPQINKDSIGDQSAAASRKDIQPWPYASSVSSSPLASNRDRLAKGGSSGILTATIANISRFSSPKRSLPAEQHHLPHSPLQIGAGSPQRGHYGTPTLSASLPGTLETSDRHSSSTQQPQEYTLAITNNAANNRFMEDSIIKTSYTDDELSCASDQSEPPSSIPVMYHAVAAQVESILNHQQQQEANCTAKLKLEKLSTLLHVSSPTAATTKDNLSRGNASTPSPLECHPPLHAGDSKSPDLNTSSYAKQTTTGGDPGTCVADDHYIPLDDFFYRHATCRRTGLSAIQVQENLQRDGLNILQSPPAPSLLFQWVKELFSGFGMVLWAALGLCVLAWKPLGDPPEVYNLIVAGVILFVLLFQTSFSLAQKSRSRNLLASIAATMTTGTSRSVQTLRQGTWFMVDSKDLVVGDVIRLASGDRIPADVRIIESLQGIGEKASLTGEADPIPLTFIPTDRNIYETRNVALFGMALLEGSITGVVFATGNRTIMARIAKLASQPPVKVSRKHPASKLAGPEEGAKRTSSGPHHTKLQSQQAAQTSPASGKRTQSPSAASAPKAAVSFSSNTLQGEIDHLVRLIAMMAALTTIAVLLGWVFFIRTTHPTFLSASALLTACIGMIVAFLPDGLPVALVMTLTLVAKQMLKEKLLVKQLDVIETLGSTTVIASDKTGTLTMNQMRVNHLCWLLSNPDDGMPRGNIINVGDARNVQSQQPKEDRHDCTGHSHNVHGGDAADDEAAIMPMAGHPIIGAMLELMTVCNKAAQQHKSAQEETQPRTPPISSPTESALFNCAQKFGCNVESIKGTWPIYAELAFSSKNKYHLTMHRYQARPQDEHRSGQQQDKEEEGLLRVLAERACFAMFQPPLPNHLEDMPLALPQYGLAKLASKVGYLACIKGAPEMLIDHCSHYCSTAGPDGGNAEIRPMDAAKKREALELADQLAARGERILAMAIRPFRLDDGPEPDLDSVILPTANYSPSLYSGLSVFANNSTASFATSQTSKGAEDAIDASFALLFVGLVAIVDPPRPNVQGTISQCREAGISVIMVTGDHPTTAVSVARAVGIITAPPELPVLTLPQALQHAQSSTDAADAGKLALCVTGADLNAIDQDSSGASWDCILAHCKQLVLARTTPEHKLELVRQLQCRGQIVTVTGDGINDAPALKCADVGIAMGSGSTVSKDAANMVLLDDRFDTVLTGIRAGRVVFDNLRKVVAYLLPAGSFSEIIPVLAWVFVGVPLPLSTFYMIVVCVGTDMLGSLALVREPPEDDIMQRAPRDPTRQHIFDGRMIAYTYGHIGVLESIIGFAMYFYSFSQAGIAPRWLIGAYEHWSFEWYAEKSLAVRSEALYHAQTAFFAALVIAQLWNLLAVRTRKQSGLIPARPTVLLGHMLVQALLALLVIYTPLFNTYLNTRPLGPAYFAIPAVLAGIAIFLGDEVRKYAVRRYPQGLIARIAW